MVSDKHCVSGNQGGRSRSVPRICLRGCKDEQAKCLNGTQMEHPANIFHFPGGFYCFLANFQRLVSPASTTPRGCDVWTVTKTTPVMRPNTARDYLHWED